METTTRKASILVMESRTLIHRVRTGAAFAEGKYMARNSYRLLDEAKLILRRADALIVWVDDVRPLQKRI